MLLELELVDEEDEVAEDEDDDAEVGVEVDVALDVRTEAVPSELAMEKMPESEYTLPALDGSVKYIRYPVPARNCPAAAKEMELAEKALMPEAMERLRKGV